MQPVRHPGLFTTVILVTALAMLCGAGASAQELVLGARHQVTTASGYHPRWSPDSARIAYVAGDWPDISIEVMPAAGGAPTPVPVGRIGDLSLTWHPDGQDLAFDAYNDGTGQLDIYSVHLDSGVVTRLTHLVGVFGPHWRADGERLSFGRGGDIWSMASGGSDFVRHTSGPGFDYYQQWSPDGTRLAYAADVDGNTDIWILELAGGGLTRFTTDPGQDARVVWSPDGQWLAWTSDRSGVRQNYARPVAGGETVHLSAGHTEADMPDWSPDSSAICYVGDGEVWVVAIDGITPTQKTSLGSMKARFRR